MIFDLYNSDTVSNPLIKDSIEPSQLESELGSLIFEANLNKIEPLITPS